MRLCIGLFGTCGDSTWRDIFIRNFVARGIPYYNPQVADWTPECAIVEAEHLAEDDTILFPITSETYGMGSIAETGFSILNAVRLDDRRDFVIMIEQELDDSLDDPLMRKESLRGRALVLQHLKKLRLPNVYLVDTLDEMLTVSIELFASARIRDGLRQYNPHNR